MRASLRWVFPILVALTGVALAQGSPSAAPAVPGNTVPTWIFYWVLGLVTAGAVIWSAITKILWDRGTEAQKATITAQEKSSVLTDEEKDWLRQLYVWHKATDDDQIPLWYVPRAWVDLLHSLRSDNVETKALLTKLVEWHEELIADLRSQIKESRGLQVQQQTKMLKLAVRVQRAVETLAGLQPPEIEDDLDDDDIEEDA